MDKRISHPVPKEQPLPIDYHSWEEYYAEDEAQARQDKRQNLFIVAALMLVVLFGIGLYFLVSTSVTAKNADPCWARPQSFACIDQRVKECMASEVYTQDQCVILIGGNK